MTSSNMVAENAFTIPTKAPAAPEDISKAESIKEEGNKHFAQGNYEQSLECYEEAIRLVPDCAIYYNNASASCGKMGEWGQAALYANEAIKLDPTLMKAYFRRATAQIGLEQWKSALEDLRKVVKANGGKATAEVAAKMQECERQLQKIAFERAIHVDVFQLDMEHIRNIDVDVTYAGPRVEDDALITPAFCHQLKEWLREDHRLHPHFAYRILYEAKQLFQALPNVHTIAMKEPGKQVTVCGDVHGQFFDLLRIFELNDDPSDDHAYLFNGDLVDRGAYSVEVLLYLLALKCAFPNSLHIARGNHESESVNRMHGFFEEVSRKYEGSAPMFSMMNAVLNCLPLCHIVQEQYFVVHGGLPMAAVRGLSIEDIQKINRFCVPEPGSVMSQLLWSDPQDAPGISPSHRGEGILFGPDITKHFLQDNNLKKIIRSHVWEEAGYNIHHSGDCITIFSAPNYSGAVSKAAYININHEGEMDFVQFDAAPYQGKAQKPRPAYLGRNMLF